MDNSRKSRRPPQESFCEQSDLKFYFVLTDEVEDDDDLNVVCSMVKDYFPKDEDVQWIKEEECLKLRKSNLTKKDVFVFKAFKGSAFEFLQGTKSLLTGPKCLISCIDDDTPIPTGMVFNSAMKNLSVCASGFSNSEKMKLAKLIQWMGGKYCNNLTETQSHLVTNTVKSAKYELASKFQLKIMLSSWIEEAWEKSQTEDISANDAYFDKHKIPIFFDLVMSSTGLNKATRNQCQSLVEMHGGELKGTFTTTVTTILLVNRDNTESEKFRCAVQAKVDCLTPEWVIDSVAAGYALPTNDYKVSAIKVSTPKKDCQGKLVHPKDFNPDCSVLSDISRIGKASGPMQLSETMSSTMSQTIRTSSRLKAEPQYKNVLKQIDIRLAQKAGSFLDGCTIYLSGFKDDDKEKLNRILNGGGAIRFEELTDRITHVLIGEPVAADFEKITRNNYTPSILHLDWLLESISLKQPAPEIKYIYRKSLPIPQLSEQPSPASKRNLEKMASSFKKPNIPKFKLNASTSTDNAKFKENENLLSQYLEKNTSTLPPPAPPAPKEPEDPTPLEPHKMTESEYTQTETDTNYYNALDGKKVTIFNYSEEFYTTVLDLVQDTRAQIVDQSDHDEVDFLVVPIEVGLSQKINVKAKEVVSELWISDVVNFDIQEIQYYHRAVARPANAKLLADVNIVFSTYTGTEREFLFYVCQNIGANVHEKYVKRIKPILVCPGADGEKYKAAVNWKYTVVTKDWLMKCHEKGCVLHVTPFLVGESTSAMFDDLNICTEQQNNDESEMITFANPVVESTRLPSPSQNRDDSTIKDNYATKEIELAKENPISIESPIVMKRPIAADPSISKDSRRSSITPFNRSILDEPSSSKTDLSTPVMHKAIRGLKENSHRNESPSSYVTPPSRKRPISVSPITPADPDYFVKMLKPEDQAIVRQVMMEYENKDTPNTKKYKKLIETPGTRRSPPTPKIPDNIFSPPLLEKVLKALAKNPPVTESLEYTPIDEQRRRIFKRLQPEDAYDSDDPIWEDFKEINYYKKPKKKTPMELLNEASEEYFRNLAEENKKKSTNEVFWSDTQSQCASSQPVAIQSRPAPCFNISCTDDVQKKLIIEQILKLKGTVCKDLMHYDASCTHIVCEMPNRSEKIFGAIAAGKWVLSLNYIADSLAEGFFLDEELYEWGNPKATKIPSFSKDSSYCGNVAYRWRKKSSESGYKGPFSDFNVILNVNKKEQFSRLIEAGGGTVSDIPSSPLTRASLDGITHWFVHEKRCKISQKDRLALESAEIPIVSVVYLNAMLVEESPVDINKYLVKQSN